MKEGLLVGFVTIGLLILLVAIVASGFEDSGPISMARHFPVSSSDLNRAETLGHGYRLCQLDFIHRNRTQFAAPSVLAESSESVCVLKLDAVTAFLTTKGYSAEVTAREVRMIKDIEDAATGKLITALYHGQD